MRYSADFPSTCDRTGLPCSSAPPPHLSSSSACHGNCPVWRRDRCCRPCSCHHRHCQVLLLYLGGSHCASVVRDHFPGLQKTDISLEFMLSFLAILVQLGAGGGPGQGAEQDNLGDQKFCAGLTTGLAYAAGLTVYRGALNPARALGPAFVANRLLVCLFRLYAPKKVFQVELALGALGWPTARGRLRCTLLSSSSLPGG